MQVDSSLPNENGSPGLVKEERRSSHTVKTDTEEESSEKELIFDSKFKGQSINPAAEIIDLTDFDDDYIYDDEDDDDVVDQNYATVKPSTAPSDTNHLEGAREVGAVVAEEKKEEPEDLVFVKQASERSQGVFREKSEEDEIPKSDSQQESVPEDEKPMSNKSNVSSKKSSKTAAKKKKTETKRESRSSEKTENTKRSSRSRSQKDLKRRSRSTDPKLNEKTRRSRSSGALKRDSAKATTTVASEKKRSSSSSPRKPVDNKKAVSDFKIRKQAKEKRASELQVFLGEIGDTLEVQERSDDSVSFLSVPKDLEDGGISKDTKPRPSDPQKNNPMVSMNDDDDEDDCYPRLSYGLEALMSQDRDEKWENVSETTEEVETVLGEDMDEEMGMMSVDLQPVAANGLEPPAATTTSIEENANFGIVSKVKSITTAKKANATAATAIVAGLMITMLVVIIIVFSNF